MKKYIKNSLIFIFVISFTALTNAEFRLGVDYRIVDNPLPVKRAVSYTHLTQPKNREV